MNKWLWVIVLAAFGIGATFGVGLAEDVGAKLPCNAAILTFPLGAVIGAALGVIQHKYEVR